MKYCFAPTIVLFLSSWCLAQHTIGLPAINYDTDLEERRAAADNQAWVWGAYGSDQDEFSDTDIAGEKLLGFFPTISSSDSKDGDTADADSVGSVKVNGTNVDVWMQHRLQCDARGQGSHVPLSEARGFAYGRQRYTIDTNGNNHGYDWNWWQFNVKLDSSASDANSNDTGLLADVDQIKCRVKIYVLDKVPSSTGSWTACEIRADFNNVTQKWERTGIYHQEDDPDETDTSMNHTGDQAGLDGLNTNINVQFCTHPDAEVVVISEIVNDDDDLGSVYWDNVMYERAKENDNDYPTVVDLTTDLKVKVELKDIQNID